jgi:hypothetical protein
MESFAEWTQWWARWGNRPEPGLIGGGFRERREKPAPPAWLIAECDGGEFDLELDPACELLEDWRRDYPATLARQVRATGPAQLEEASKTIWWEHVHMDVLWPAMQWQASVYGVVGVHSTATVRGRLQVFLAPGVMLLNVPASNGTRAWKLAASYGMGYRLLDFTFPGSRPASLHLNLAKAWLLPDVGSVNIGRSVDFVGFSITFKKSR